MNDRGRQALIDAQLQGIPQIRHKLYDGKGGLCAAGVLYVAHGLITREGRRTTKHIHGVYPEFGMTPDEWGQMIRMNDNDNLGYDFIKIAWELPDTEGMV